MLDLKVKCVRLTVIYVHTAGNTHNGGMMISSLLFSLGLLNINGAHAEANEGFCGSCEITRIQHILSYFPFTLLNPNQIFLERKPFMTGSKCLLQMIDL